MFENIKVYFKKVDSKYPLINIMFFSLIIVLVLHLIDIYNMIPNFFTQVEIKSPRTISSLVLVVLIVILGMVKVNLSTTFNYPTIYWLDKVILIVLSTCTIFQLLIIINGNTASLLKWSPIIIILLSLLLLRKRIKSVEILMNQSNSSIIELKDVLEGRIPKETPFLIREKEVEYDLLSRESQIYELTELITHYQSKERFVIGIEGEWGSGKTTLIKNVLFKIKESNEENKHIIIDDFEPWLADNKVSLLENLLNAMLKDSALKITNQDMRKIFDSTLKLVFGDKIQFKSRFFQKDSSRQVEEIVSDINEVLIKKNKKIIFVIDNLDRISGENILLLLNIVQNVLNFNNLIVILLYDKKELLEKLEEENVSRGYLDKLIQKEVTIPVLEMEEQSSFYFEVIQALANNFKIELFETDKIKKFILILIESNQLNMRDFKRLLNSVIIPVFKSDSNKYLLDILIIEYIKYSNYSLYNEIYYNSEYFISEDRDEVRDKLIYLGDKPKYDKKLNQYFEDLEKRYNSYVIKILAIIFPNLKNYLDDSQISYLEITRGRLSDEYSKVQKNNRIFSEHYFSSYFILNLTSQHLLSVKVKNKINSINKGEINVSRGVDELLNQSADCQYEIINNLIHYLDNLSPKFIKEGLKELLLKYHEFKGYGYAISSDITFQLEHVISKMMYKIDLIEFKDIVDEYLTEPKYLGALDGIHNKLMLYDTGNNNRKNYIKRNIERIVEKTLVHQKINIFEENIYSKDSSLVLYNYARERECENFYKEYVKLYLNPETVYRIINIHTISLKSSSNEYIYHINDDIEYYLDINNLKVVLEKASINNEKEKLILAIFKKYLTGEKDDFGEPIGITRKTPIDLRYV